MLLIELHHRDLLKRDIMIIEGVVLSRRLISEGLGQFLLRLAKGLGKLVFKSVALCLKAGCVLGASLLSSGNRPSAGFDPVIKEIDNRIKARYHAVLDLIKKYDLINKIKSKPVSKVA